MVRAACLDGPYTYSLPRQELLSCKLLTILAVDISSMWAGSVLHMTHAFSMVRIVLRGSTAVF